MITITKKRTTAVSFLLAFVLLVCSFSTTAFAAGTETFKKGTTDIGSFTFTDTNTTPVKTIMGTKATFSVTWRVADGYNGIPDIDKGIGNAKLTMQILDATTGKALTNKIPFNPSSDSWFTTSKISVNVTSGQKIKIWFDASSTGASNGNFRSIHVKFFDVTVS